MRITSRAHGTRSGSRSIWKSSARAKAALLSLAFGCAILFVGDKVVRPLAAREGTHLGFVWVLMGCLGGFEALGLVGVVIGPVVLTLARELWAERMRRPDAASAPVPLVRRA